MRIRVKVAAVSANRNSFGLAEHVLIARDGRAWTACANHLNTRKVGDEFVIVDDDFARLGFEIPRELDPPAPPEVVQQVWGE